jgi:glyoxylase-like metal-dependent hydrolase (beta-lactamase superfamily II)
MMMARAHRIAPAVWRIPTVPLAINAYLVAAADGLTIVDPGMSVTYRRLARGIEATGHSPSQVRTIVATHAHIDHAGALARLKAVSGARVLAHEHDRSFIEQGIAPPGDPSSRLARSMERAPTGYPPCPIDEGLVEGDAVDGLRVIHTPGHTPGHICLLHTDSGVLLTGDAVINPLFVRYPFEWFCTDLAAVRASAARLATLDFGIVGFAHGMPLPAGGRERIASLGTRPRR